MTRRQYPRLKKLLDWRRRGGTSCRCEWCRAEERRNRSDADGYRYFAQESTNWAEATLPFRSDGFR